MCTRTRTLRTVASSDAGGQGKARARVITTIFPLRPDGETPWSLCRQEGVARGTTTVTTTRVATARTAHAVVLRGRPRHVLGALTRATLAARIRMQMRCSMETTRFAAVCT
eukprot:Amastigsp_a847754_15.p5 type:complete len:111 gc:universal Amastigsp_a847754_15:749-417(-)